MRTSIVLAVCAVAACGGGKAASDGPVVGDAAIAIDVAEAIDAPADAMIDAPADAMVDAPPDAPPPPPCDYTEQADATNGNAAEPTGITIGATTRRLCGAINPGHFEAATRTVDADTYRVSSDGTLSVLVRYSAPAAAGELSVLVFDTAANPTLLSGDTRHPGVADHGAFVATLPAGTYDVVVAVHNPSDLAAAFDYRISLTSDPPTRCAAVTTPASYTEAGDGAGAGNDVIAVRFGADPTFALTAASDTAEPTGLTIGGAALRITGSSADENADDDYMDRDTYLVRTGAQVNELTLRIDWADAGVDLDYVVFPAEHLDDIGHSLLATPKLEYNVIPVAPSTAYWIWIGSHDGSAALPAAYDLSICGTTEIP